MNFSLKSARAMADIHGMGRLLQFPLPAGDEPDSENRVAMPLGAVRAPKSFEETPLKGAIDPAQWGVPRAFFIVHQPPTTFPSPDQKLVC